jgi:DNA-directed RNA polymerase subunit F
MKVLNQESVPLSELKEYITLSEEQKPLQDYLKKFTKLPKTKSKALAKEVKDLNSPKIKEHDITKISDFVPKTQEEINKIFTDVSLSEEEANAITEITSKY